MVMKKTLIFLLLLFGAFVSAQASVLDSVGVEKKGDAYFIQHKMEAKETLYALSRRYSATVDEIKKANPGVNINDIGIGQIILVPAKNYKPKPAATAVSSAVPASGKKVHKVEPKETLFALSQKYGVTVDELKKANPALNEKGLQVGMELVIPGKATSAVAVTETKKPEPEPAAKPAQNTNAATGTTPAATPKPATTAPVAVKPKSEPLPARLTPTDLPSKNNKIEKINENGMAETAPARQDAPDFFAYHKTAPVGTIILVVNDQNNQNAYVRVIGTLINPSSETSVIQLSPKAMERIKAGETKTKVSLSYFMP